MKVAELRAKLESLPDDMEVILQKDSEGNGFSPLYGLDVECVYVAETKWYGDVYDANSSAEEHDMDEEEWNKLLAQPRSLILYPVN